MDYEIVISLVSLITLEVILGIDNVIFISILSTKLPENQQKKARLYGLLLAMVLRLGLLAIVAWILKLEDDLFTLFNEGISIKDLILIAGGLFYFIKVRQRYIIKWKAKKEIKLKISKRVPSPRSFCKF